MPNDGDSLYALHLAIGVAIGALASTVMGDVFKCIKTFSLGVRNRMFIMFAKCFKVRSLTITKSTCNTTMPAALREHGIRSYDSVAMFEVNEAADASIEVGHMYLPTRSWTIYILSMLGWTHIIHATHDINHITVVGPSQGLRYLCEQSNAVGEQDKTKYSKLTAAAFGLGPSLNFCDRCGLVVDLCLSVVIVAAMAWLVSVWTSLLLCGFPAYYAWVLVTSSDVAEDVEEIVTLQTNETPLLYDDPMITVSLLCCTGRYFELVRTQHYQAKFELSQAKFPSLWSRYSASQDDIAWIQTPVAVSMQADMDVWLETCCTDLVYVCAFDPSHDPPVNGLIDVCRKGKAEVTMIIVLPQLQGLVQFLDRGLLYGNAEVKTTSGLHHWILQVTSGQFQHLRLVIPMVEWVQDAWPTLARVPRIDMTAPRHA